MNNYVGLVIRLERTYKQLRKAQVEFHLGEKYAAEAKAKFEFANLEGLASGLIVGKNANERELSAREKLNDLWEDRNRTKERANRAKLHLTLAQLEVDHARTLIRVEEIKIGRLPNAGH